MIAFAVIMLLTAVAAQEADVDARSPYYAPLPPPPPPPPRPYPPPPPYQQPYQPARPGAAPPAQAQAQAHAQAQAQAEAHAQAQAQAHAQAQAQAEAHAQAQAQAEAQAQAQAQAQQQQHQTFQPPGGQQAPLLPGPAVHMSVLDTVVTCESRNMRVQFSLSAPFHGIIYPYNHFHNCLLHEGSGERSLTLLLGHGTCANENGLAADGSLTPVIEHRLMIQWDRDIVEEWDSSIIVRCDRPEDYNKTISFDLSTVDEAASFVSSTHPGPQMWMEIQKGEGPNAPELQGSVFLGQVLTLVFTLADQYFDFDTNVLTCWALDGESEKRKIEWLDPGTTTGSQFPQRRYTGEMEVINQGCSAKPKIFGHFYKLSDKIHGQRSITQYAFFKAFRFPTSSRVVIQCNVQVCYRKCDPMRPCSESYQPRASSPADEPAQRRRRRQASGPDDERVSLVRAIEVRLPEEAADLPGGEVPAGGHSPVRYNSELACAPCGSLTTFFVVLVSLAGLLALLIGAVLWVYVRRGYASAGTLGTPTK